MSDNTVDEQASNAATEAAESPVAPADPPAESSAEPSAASDAAPPDVAPSDAAPSDAAPSDAAPSDAAPSEAAPSDAAAPVAEPAERALPVSPAADDGPNEEPSQEHTPPPSYSEPDPASAKALTPSAYEPNESQKKKKDKKNKKKSMDNNSTALLEEKKPDNVDAETTDEKLKYPKSVLFIISNEFCERFSYYGLRTILVLYLTSILSYEEEDATVIYHVFLMLCYFFPLIGSMIADSWLGKFNTIFFLSIVYAIGNIIVSFASSAGSIDIPGRELTILGLLLIAFGTGGIKPCVSAFGGDQFKLPQQEKQMAQFFSLFYFAINSGSFLSTFLTPVLREDVKCFDQTSCYPLAFGVPAILMIVSIIIFALGKRLYIIKKPQGNVVIQVCKTMSHAVAEKWRSKGPKRDHWLDYADDKFEKKDIEDIKSALRVLYLYIPLPVFWALFDQQGSRWTFQATMMTGDLGGWSLKPDQVQVVNPLLILLFIPMFETIIYPLLKKCNLLTRPLQRLGVGGVLAGVAFVISAIVELQVEKTYAVLPKSGEGQIRIFNGLDCPSTFNFNGADVTINGYDMWYHQRGPVSGEEVIPLSLKICDAASTSASITFLEKKARSYLITTNGLIPISEEDDLGKEKEMAKARIICNNVEGTVKIGSTSASCSGPYGIATLDPLTPNEYELKIDEKPFGNVKLKVGGVYSLMLPAGDKFKQFELTPPNKVHMLWLIPQYVVLTMGEVMFSITGLEFSYSQAPLSMKSVLQAGWLLSVAFGNLIVVIIAEAQFFDRQLWEYVLFGGLMFVDMFIFALMAWGYKYIETPHEGQDLPLETTEKKGIENANFHKDDE